MAEEEWLRDYYVGREFCDGETALNLDGSSVVVLQSHKFRVNKEGKIKRVIREDTPKEDYDFWVVRLKTDWVYLEVPQEHLRKYNSKRFILD